MVTETVGMDRVCSSTGELRAALSLFDASLESIAILRPVELKQVTYWFWLWAGIAQSVYRLTTGRTVRGSNRGGMRYSARVQTEPGAHPTSSTMGTGSFPVVKRPGRGVDHLPLSSPYSPLGLYGLL